jgi:hypothetical protein
MAGYLTSPATYTTAPDAARKIEETDGMGMIDQRAAAVVRAHLKPRQDGVSEDQARDMPEARRKALDMLNEIHRRMGTELAYQARMERLLVDKIAEQHFQDALDARDAEIARLRGVLNQIHQTASYPGETNPDSVGRDDRYQKLVERIAEMSGPLNT